MDINQIFRNNNEWIEGKLAADADYFKTLSLDQTPQILYIGCSDSRVTAEELMGAKPGEVFVYRNIANMITSIDLSAQTVINYAVTQLNVKHIVVCGHYNCGGVKSAMQSVDFGILNPWLRNIRDVYRLHKKELDAISDLNLRYNRLVELNVEEQCFNVLKTPEVQRACREKALTVHGWIFDIHSGRLIDLKIDFNAMLESIRQIYNIS